MIYKASNIPKKNFKIKINLKKFRPLFSRLLNHMLIWSFLIQPIYDSFFCSNASSIFVVQTIIITKLQLLIKVGLSSCVFLSPYTSCWIFRGLHLKLGYFVDNGIRTEWSPICNGNRIVWSLIWSVMIWVRTKSSDCTAGVQFVYHKYDYRLNWITQSLNQLINDKYNFQKKKNSQVLRERENLH